MDKKAPPRMFLFLLLRVMPLATAVLLITGYLTIRQTSNAISTRELAHHAAKQDHAQLTMISRLETLKESARVLTGNNLVINSLFDPDSRDQYLPIFFRSLRMPGSAMARISLVDYKGRPIITNKLPAPFYGEEGFWDSVSKKNEHLDLSSERLLFATPIVYHGITEGAIVVEYSPDQFTPFFDIEVGTDAVEIIDKKGFLIFSHHMHPSLAQENFFWIEKTLNNYENISIKTGMLIQKSIALTQSLQQLLIFTIALNLMLLVAILAITTRLVTRPMEKLAAEIQKMTQSGELDGRIEEGGPRELHAVASLFNGFLDRLQETMISREAFQKKIKALTKAHGQGVMQEKITSVGQLAAGLAHELNSPINMLRTLMATLKENITDLTEILKGYRTFNWDEGPQGVPPLEIKEVKAREEALEIEQTLASIPELLNESDLGFERITTITESMLNFSHPDRMETMTQFNINKGIENTLTIARNTYKHHADIETNLGEIPKITCFPEQLNQVFLNLIVNSAQAIESLKRPNKGTITIQTLAQNDHVLCRIADDGPGIPEEILPRIFEPFFTTKAPTKGTGLGLSISFDIIVHTHKGSLSVDCPENGGTVFTMRLPVNPASATPDPSPQNHN